MYIHKKLYMGSQIVYSSKCKQKGHTYHNFIKRKFKKKERTLVLHVLNNILGRVLRFTQASFALSLITVLPMNSFKNCMANIYIIIMALKRIEYTPYLLAGHLGTEGCP